MMDERRCSLLHRRDWRLTAHKLSGPTLLGAQRHIGIYECGHCGRKHRIVGPKQAAGEIVSSVDQPMPERGAAMRLHVLLGGPSGRQP